jgi:hypothetical protein
MANEKTSIWSVIKAIGAFGILVTVFMSGFSISNSNWSASNANLQIELTRARDEATKARAESSRAGQELATAKADYALIAARHADSKLQTNALSVVAPPSDIAETNRASLFVSAEGTTSAFDGDILISVSSIDFGGSPLRHRVNAVVGAPGFPGVAMDNVDVGYVTNILAKWRYEVRVTQADTFSAGFMVIRLPHTERL